MCGEEIGGGRRENKEGGEGGKGRKGPAFLSAKREPENVTLPKMNTDSRCGGELPVERRQESSFYRQDVYESDLISRVRF